MTIFYVKFIPNSRVTQLFLNFCHVSIVLHPSIPLSLFNTYFGIFVFLLVKSFKTLFYFEKKFIFFF